MHEQIHERQEIYDSDSMHDAPERWVWAEKDGVSQLDATVAKEHNGNNQEPELLVVSPWRTPTQYTLRFHNLPTIFRAWCTRVAPCSKFRSWWLGLDRTRQHKSTVKNNAQYHCQP